MRPGSRWKRRTDRERRAREWWRGLTWTLDRGEGVVTFNRPIPKRRPFQLHAWVGEGGWQCAVTVGSRYIQTVPASGRAGVRLSGGTFRFAPNSGT